MIVEKIDLTLRELTLLFQAMETQAMVAMENGDKELEKEWIQILWKFSPYLPPPKSGGPLEAAP